MHLCQLNSRMRLYQTSGVGMAIPHEAIGNAKLVYGRGRPQGSPWRAVGPAVCWLGVLRSLLAVALLACWNHILPSSKFSPQFDLSRSKHYVTLISDSNTS